MPLRDPRDGLNRREISLQLAGGAALAVLGLAPAGASAQQHAPVEGRDYATLEKPVVLPRTGKIEVVEFFWYGCPHCYAFEPVLEPWVAKLPADVHFSRVPYGFDEALREVHQQVYYTLDALGLIPALHAKTFDRFNKQHRPIDNIGDMLVFASDNGLDLHKVKNAWNGFAVQTKLHQARDFCDDYGVDFVPQLGIAGRFLTAPSMAGDGPKALAATDTLIGLVRKGS